MEAKGCDMVVANDVSQPGVGFDASMNEVWLVRKEGEEKLERDTKYHIALRIVQESLSLVTR